jgi:hypothetical protein
MKKGILIGLLLITISFNSYTQSITSYSFGSIGNTGDQSPRYTGSIDIQGSECFMLTSGVAVLLEKNSGEYVNNCEVNSVLLNTLSLTANPNPISTFTYIKFTKQHYFQNDEKVFLQLFNQKGYIVQQYTTNLSQLNNGFELQLSNILNNGVYFLKATNSNRIFKTLTLLKQD